ncbi:hypothetical protein PGIGA_G00215130 [Pangasianodon gigas]|uniref:Uncharacterized protein n=1 Tax=Pangasianodon gigas TaxID=30993 RepID=A0ACC5WHM5_PANGG|nr:hypothetical protein [Pangasianodon gigas]
MAQYLEGAMSSNKQNLIRLKGFIWHVKWSADKGLCWNERSSCQDKQTENGSISALLSGMQTHQG